jgi:CBS domain containing-hemolysin-like protein
MEDVPDFVPTAGTFILAGACYLGAMLMAGLLAACHRLSALDRNRLLEPERLGPVVSRYLTAARRSELTISSLYLTATVLGVFACGRLLAGVWIGELGVRFHVVLAVLIVVAWTFGALLFRIMASGTAVGYVRVVGTLVWPLTWLLRPWVGLLLVIMDRLDDTLWASAAQPLLSTGEIRSLIDDDEDEVDLDADERAMIRSIFAFHDTAVREIMVPRIDVVGFEQSAPLDEVIATVNDCRHSRLPIYDGSMDRVVGVLYAKDLLDLVRDGRVIAGGRTLADLMRPAYFIPESKKIDEVLDEFRAKRIHMAVVIDEYGGTAGIVTLEDVLEEIVGEIEDEFDEDEPLYAWQDPATLQVDPRINLEDLAAVLGRALVTGDDDSSETLGGLIYEAAGSVPAAGDTVKVGDLDVTVEKVEDQRILQAVIRSPQPLPGWPREQPPPPPDDPRTAAQPPRDARAAGSGKED